MPKGAFLSLQEIAMKRHLVTLAAILMASTAFAHEVTVGC
jgi:hypothetical protein